MKKPKEKTPKPASDRIQVQMLKDYNCNVTQPDGAVSYVRAKKGDVLEVGIEYAQHLVDNKLAGKPADPKGAAPENKAAKGPTGKK